MLSGFLIIDRDVSYKNWRSSSLIDKEEYPSGIMKFLTLIFWFSSFQESRMLWKWIVVCLVRFVWTMINLDINEVNTMLY